MVYACVKRETLTGMRNRGGLDQSFNGLRETKITLAKETDDDIILRDLINHLATNYIHSQKDLDIFIQDDTIRPGILVLINDTDWELEEKDEYILESGDLISFTSTLHGG